MLPSSLTRVLSSALEYSSHPPVSVCGTVPYNLSLEILSRHPSSTHFASLFAPLPFVPHLRWRISLPPSQAQKLRPELPSSGWASPYASSLRNCKRYGNMNPFPISYAFQPHLRGRLTLGRRPLPRNPRVFGGGDSHPSFRYSCLHSLFCSLQQNFHPAFFGPQNARLPPESPLTRGFGTRLSPVTLSAHNYSTSELLRTLSRHGCF